MVAMELIRGSLGESRGSGLACYRLRSALGANTQGLTPSAISPELTLLFFVSQEIHNPIGKVRKSPIDVSVKVK